MDLWVAHAIADENSWQSWAMDFQLATGNNIKENAQGRA